MSTVEPIMLQSPADGLQTPHLPQDTCYTAVAANQNNITRGSSVKACGCNNHLTA